ncbi:hypothetical protein FOCC_FOCC017096, partial [Frankliniella occidentalis]
MQVFGFGEVFPALLATEVRGRGATITSFAAVFGCVSNIMDKMSQGAGTGAPPSGRGPIVGIDLGTTYSVVAVHLKGRVEILSNDSGSRTTPSVVGFLSGDNFVGEAARDLPPQSQVFDAKRLIGRPWKHVVNLACRKHWPFGVFDDCGVPRIKVKVDDREEEFAPEE